MSHSFFSVGWLSSHERHCSSVRPPALLKVPSSASLSSPRKSPLSMSMLKSATETQDMTQSIQHMLPAVLLYTEGIWLPQPTPQATEPTCQQTGDEWSDQTGRRQEGVECWQWLTWTYLLFSLRQTCGEPPSPLQVSLFFSPPTQIQDGWILKFFPLNLSWARNFVWHSPVSTIGILTFFRVSLKKPWLSRFYTLIIYQNI